MKKISKNLFLAIHFLYIIGLVGILLSSIYYRFFGEKGIGIHPPFIFSIFYLLLTAVSVFLEKRSSFDANNEKWSSFEKYLTISVIIVLFIFIFI